MTVDTVRTPIARRLTTLPPYLFARIDAKIADARRRGIEVLSLGIGDPDVPTPPHVIEAGQKAAADHSTHTYPPYEGIRELREAVARYYERRFGVKVDPASEVLILLGAKDGVAHLPLCLVDPGDCALVPDPGYPVYSTSVMLAGGKGVTFPAETIPTDDDVRRAPGPAKLVFLNFPNNPTGMTVELDTFESYVALARRNNLVLCHDAAYIDVCFGGYQAPSILQVPGARDVAIEIGSASKTYNMTGWRVGWAVGCAKVIEVLKTLKTNIDSGQFAAAQWAVVAALDGPQDCVAEMQALYRRRLARAADAFNSLGWHAEPPRGSIYLWLPVPAGMTSAGFAELVLERAGVVITPGSGYGARGEGHFRVSVTVPDHLLEKALTRMEQAEIRWSG